jgi:DNA-binding transcriptional ArsR family regulator
MTTRPRTDWTTRIGLAVVAASAIATSFSALTGLARIAGWSAHIAFTLPLIVDTLGVVGTKVWLSGPTGVRPLARRVALLAIVCSVSGNIAYHLVAAGLLHPSVWLVVIIGATPPVALGLVGHVAASLAAAPAIESAQAPEPAPVALPGLTESPAVSVALVPAVSVPDTDVRTDTEPDIIADAVPDIAPDTASDTQRTSARTPRRTDTAAKLARLRDKHPDMSATELAARLGVTDRTVRRHLAALAAA